jgi:hypothetical protein
MAFTLYMDCGTPHRPVQQLVKRIRGSAMSAYSCGCERGSVARLIRAPACTRHAVSGCKATLWVWAYAFRALHLPVEVTDEYRRGRPASCKLVVVILNVGMPRIDLCGSTARFSFTHSSTRSTHQQLAARQRGPRCAQRQRPPGSKAALNHHTASLQLGSCIALPAPPPATPSFVIGISAFYPAPTSFIVSRCTPCPRRSAMSQVGQLGDSPLVGGAGLGRYS